MTFVLPGTPFIYGHAAGLSQWNITQGMAVVSETRFRPARCRRRIDERRITSNEFRARYQEEQGGY
jgi:hypothetical protein